MPPPCRRPAAAPDLPFQLRPGLVAEMLRFYDQLAAAGASVNRFEELIVARLDGATTIAAPSGCCGRRVFWPRRSAAYEQRLASTDGVSTNTACERT